MSIDNESLASAYQRCRQDFSILTASLDKLGSLIYGSSLSWEDEASRLQLWGTNIGAAQSKASTSLDFRLRDADTVRHQIYKNLSDLDDALKDALQSLSNLAGSADSRSTQQATSKQVHDSIPFKQPVEDGDNCDSESLQEDLEAAFEDVVSIINLLFRMTLYIRNPSRRDQLKHRDTSAVADYETFDVSHIEHKFPRAEDSLTRRLGQANTVRRANLRYWERHHKKLAVDETTEADNATVAVPLSESIATAFKPAENAEELPDTRSHFSGTSYMESMIGGDSIRRPDLPEVGKTGAPFQCPICCYIITVSGQREWMKHVFFDLQPYVCIFEDCKTPLLLYENRRDWFAHVANNHLSRAEATSGIQRISCPLCQEALQTIPMIRRHLARHLEEVALFSLPNSMFGEETEMVDDDAASDSNSEHDLVGDALHMADQHDYPPIAPKLEDVVRIPGYRGGKNGDLQRYDETARWRDPKDGLWTEITKGLIIKDAIDQMAYKYEETEDFFYILQHLDYDAVSKLVGLSEYMRRNPHVLTSGFPLTRAQRAQADEEWKRRGKTTLYGSESTTEALTQADPPDLDSTTGKLELLSTIFDTTWLPHCMEFIHNPPADNKVARNQYLRLSEGISAQISRVIDGIDTVGDASTTTKRSSLKKHVDTVLTDLRRALERIDDSQVDEKDEVAEYMIKCICGYADDDGNTINCPKCSTWQHIECYYSIQHPPGDHICSACRPRVLDAWAAAERMKARREALRDNSESVIEDKDDDDDDPETDRDFERKNDLDLSASLLSSTDRSTTITGQTFDSATAQLQASEAIFRSDLLPQCKKFLDHVKQSAVLDDVQSEHLRLTRLTEALMSRIIMTADVIDTSDDTAAQLNRRTLIRAVNKTLKELDDALKHYLEGPTYSNYEAQLPSSLEDEKPDHRREPSEPFLTARGSSVHYKNDRTEHTDAEWEAQKDNFTSLYITENMTLSSAARRMAEDNGFVATPRQWERKVQKWGLKKYYSSQEHRLRQIEPQQNSPLEESTAGLQSPSLDAEENILEREEIIIRRDESENWTPPWLRERSREREEIIIRRTEDDRRYYRPPPRAISTEREEIIIRREERDSDSYIPRSRYEDYAPRLTSQERESGNEEERILIRRDERNYKPPLRQTSRDEEEIIIRRPDSDLVAQRGRREREPETEEIIIRRRKRDSDTDEYVSRPRYEDYVRRSISLEKERSQPREGSGEETTSKDPSIHSEKVLQFDQHPAKDADGAIDDQRDSDDAEQASERPRQRDPKEGMWTEITKDMVLKEAIVEMGYEFKETDEFYYVMRYLRYEDIVRLQGLSEDIRKERRKRTKKIDWENRVEPPDKDSSERDRRHQDDQYDANADERYIEREIVYRGGRPPPPPVRFGEQAEDAMARARNDEERRNLRTGQQANSKASNPPVNNRTIFVGNLSFDTTSAGLRQAFEHFGPVSHARVVADTMTGRSKGFGYVTFDEHISAERAIEELHNTLLDGNVLRIDFAAAPETDSNKGTR